MRTVWKYVEWVVVMAAYAAIAIITWPGCGAEANLDTRVGTLEADFHQHLVAGGDINDSWTFRLLVVGAIVTAIMASVVIIRIWRGPATKKERRSWVNEQ